jgi:hypothetical protein
MVIFFMVKTPVGKTGLAGALTGEIAQRIVGTSLQLDANKPKKMARVTQVYLRAITLFLWIDAR